MELTILFDHKFRLDENGIIYSNKNYNETFFAKRYLRVFDKISIFARVISDTPNTVTQGKIYSLGTNVQIISIGNWDGPANFLKHKSIWSKMLSSHFSSHQTAVLAIAPGMVGAIACKQLLTTNMPYGVEVVGDPYHSLAPGIIKHPLRPFLRLWSTYKLKQQCANACAVSYVTEFALQRHYPCSQFMFGISNVELSAESVLSSARSFDNSRPVRLIMVGTLTQLVKAPDILLQALATCLKQGIAATLQIVGDGKYRPKLEAMAHALGIAAKVEFLGQLPAGEAVRAHLDQADLFILPSWTEGLPRAMIEAMARALPCIGSAVGGIPELLPAEDVVPAGNISALAKKIQEVAGDPARMNQMSARNLKRASDFLEDGLYERRIAFYRALKNAAENNKG